MDIIRNLRTITATALVAMVAAMTTALIAVVPLVVTATPAAAATDPLASWHAALAQAATAPANVVFVGDSITEGYFAPDREGRWVDLVRARLQADYGGSGYGYLPTGDSLPSDPPFADVWQMSGGGTVSTTTGLGLRSYALQGAGATATATVTADAVQLSYTSGPHGGAMSISIDGAPGVIVDTYAASDGPGRTWNSGPLSPGTHTVSVTTDPSGTLAGTYSVVLEGMMVFDGDTSSGVRGWDSGHGGYTSQNFVDSAAFPATITQTNADLVVVELGVNDIAYGVSAAQYQQNLGTLIDRITSSDPHAPSLLLVAAMRPLADDPVIYQSYVSAMQNVALARGLAFDDMSQLSSPSMMSIEGIHPGTVGNEVVADSILQAIDPAYTAQPAPAIPPPPSGPVSALTAAATSATSVTVTWTAAPAEPRTLDSYMVQAVDTSTNAVTTRVIACGSCTQAVFTSLPTDKQYTFTVTPHTPGGSGPASTSPAIVLGTLAQPPAAASAVTASVGATVGSADVSWTAPVGPVDSYLVQTYDMSMGGAFQFQQTATSTSTSVTGLTAGHSYAFAIWAHNSAGYGPSAGSNTVLMAPAAPTGVVATALRRSAASVRWTAPYGPNDSYLVQTYDLTLDTFIKQQTVTSTSATITGLTSTHRYAFAVWAHNATGYGPSAGSNTITATK